MNILKPLQIEERENQHISIKSRIHEMKTRLLRTSTVQIWNWPNAFRCAFIIRDDDISAFTEPKMLESIYKNAWMKKFIVSSCVIPCIKARNDLNIPPSARHQQSYRRLDENTELLAYLIEKIERRQIDIVQHGFTHERIDSYPEFEALDYEEARTRLLKGSKIIKTALNVQPKVFVAPWERISREGVSAIVDCGYSYNSLVRPGHMRVPSKMPHPIPKKLSGNSLFIPRSLSLFSRFYRVHETIKRIKDQILRCYKLGGCAILTTHYWEFYYDWTNIDSPLINALNSILDFVETLNVWKTSLSSVADWWLKKEKVKVDLHHSRKEILAEISSPKSGIPEGLTLYFKIPTNVQIKSVTADRNEVEQIQYEQAQLKEILISIKNVSETKKACKVTIELT